MPRRVHILAREINIIEAGVEVQRLLRARPQERRRRYEAASRYLGLDDAGTVAVVRLEQGIVSHKECRRALVVCPYRPGLNERLKSFGRGKIQFNMHFKCWAVRADDDATVDRIVRMLLKYLDAVVFEADDLSVVLTASGTKPSPSAS